MSAYTIRAKTTQRNGTEEKKSYSFSYNTGCDHPGFEKGSQKKFAGSVESRNNLQSLRILNEIGKEAVRVLSPWIMRIMMFVKKL